MDMTHNMTPARHTARRLFVCLIASTVLWPSAVAAQQTQYDPEWFDCKEI
jgi:hypothetical protein